MIRIGTSGWSYDHWADVLYPPGLPVAKRLARYVEEFDTVELNASFYRWPKDATFAGWRERLPDGFTMSVKAHRGLTHYRRLGSPEPWVERFERCWTALGDRREALLVQLHPGDGTRRRAARPLLERDAGLDSGGDGAAPSVLGRPRRLRDARTTPRRVCGDERRRAAVCPASDQRSRVCPHARTAAGFDVRGLLPRRRVAPVGRPGRRMARRKAGGCSSTSTTTSAATPSATRRKLKELLAARVG